MEKARRAAEPPSASKQTVNVSHKWGSANRENRGVARRGNLLLSCHRGDFLQLCNKDFLCVPYVPIIEQLPRYMNMMLVYGG
jgi:hypothetical protein